MDPFTSNVRAILHDHSFCIYEKASTSSCDHGTCEIYRQFDSNLREQPDRTVAFNILPLEIWIRSLAAWWVEEAPNEVVVCISRMV
ncbi:hypothetical protein MRB53_023993 [Persea americana]|uniref:Uncharacterized protein n=1 Tax=Persea americana TaxID=3435 RepID=A0ACC2LBG2_PERAE|nr:hypothetical protein MRB53_023993 [Persea americana]